MQSITLSEAAGYAVGSLLIVAVYYTPRIDNYIACSQRRALKLCEECGGLKRKACSKCKGRGESIPFPLFSTSKEEHKICTACAGIGHFPCNICCPSQ